MAQVLRVLSDSDSVPPLQELRRILPGGFDIEMHEGTQQSWSRLVLRHSEGEEIVAIERVPIEAGGAVQAFAGKLENSRPSRAAEWLKHYLSHVRTMYALKPMPGVEVRDGWLALQMTQAYLWKKFGGILQADGEGFTNREGQHVLWAFDSPQSGELEAAVLDDSGRWQAFTMEMSDPEQVEAFKRGEVPDRARRIAS